jgi:3-hydroxyisobutyrate dehydrogenase
MEAGPVGFLGLGTMGAPMARTLVRRGVDLVVWNRSPDRARALAADGARVSAGVDDVLAACEIVLVMLANGDAVDAVLGRGPRGFERSLAGRTVVHLGTTAPAYSSALERDLRAAGASYVEAPVSGSRVPAERGELVGMLAGEPAAVARVRPVVALLCRETEVCGPVPAALTTKLVVNLFLIILVTGLAEAWHLAERHGLDLTTLRRVLDAGPMASAVSAGKLAKLAAGDFEVQAGLSDVLYNNALVAAVARASGTPTPLLDQCHRLFAEAEALGHGTDDMIGVIHALRSRVG